MDILVPNLNFEDELSGQPRQMSGQANRVMNELAPLMGLLANHGDRVLMNDDAAPAELPECLAHVVFVDRSEVSSSGGQHDIIPWGWTGRTRQTAADMQMSPTRIPPAKGVTYVNSRDFNARFDAVECDDEELLPFGANSFGVICRNFDEWERGVRQLERFHFQRWVAKPQISHAGRNRLLANGTALNSQQRAWLEKHLAGSGSVYLEPWVRPDEECGLQFEIVRPGSLSTATHGNVQLIGVTGLLNDHVGRYQGSLICQGDQLTRSWRSAVTHGYSVCEAAAVAGYFGPIGIDCFYFRLPDGSPALRLCNDINARFTMGRIALQLRSSLQSLQFGAWCHFAVPDFSRFCDRVQKGLTQPAEENVSMIITSPMSIGGRLIRSGTVLFAGDSPELLSGAVKSIRDQAAG